MSQSPMNAIVVFYSRTGTTKKVAEAISRALGCEIEELQDSQDRSGIMGWLRSGRQAMKEELTTLQPLKKDIAQYDLILIGTPVWANKMSVPIRTFITQNKASIKDVAFFVTAGGKGNAHKIFPVLEELHGKAPKATLGLQTKDVKKDLHLDKVQAFTKALSQ